MKELNNEELRSVDGGFFISLGGVALASFGIPFVAGVLDGFTRPLACR